MIKRLSLAALLLTLAVGQAQAGSSGTQGFADIGSPSVSPGADINTATTFNIGDLTTTTDQTGVFLGLPTQTFGAVTFTVGSPTSLTISDAAFGSFTSTSITEPVNSPGVVAMYILGNYTGGTFDPTVSGTASLTISFTQTPAHTGSISDSGSFSIPPAAPPGVPEPSSLLMGFIGAGIAGACYLARRKTTIRVA
jgi:hypothetical protein